MHLLIPHAAPLSEAGVQAAAGLQLPNLQALLAGCDAVERDDADACSLDPPHERARARALGLQGAGGQLPYAALQARADGLDVGESAWGLLTPVHWHLGTEQVSLMDPRGLLLDDAHSRLFHAAVEGLFTSQGYRMHYGAPLRWYIAHASLSGLPTASLDRVIGRNVDRWLGSSPALRPLRRLQAEVQMLLYTHPLNADRQARGLLPVNSVWLSGCGAWQAPLGTEPDVDETLREPALAEDWPAWLHAWALLDAGPLAALRQRMQDGLPLRLTLCGERAWLALEAAPRGLLQRLRSRFQPLRPATLLATL
jgi:hypothetical protein